MIRLGMLALVAASGAPPAAAQQADDPTRAAGFDLSVSSDAEDTEVLKAGLNLDVRHRGTDDYLGFRLERARFKPFGQQGKTFDRAYLRVADDAGGWKWNATAGSDGDTLLGSATIHDESRFRKELFVEREMIETPLGIAEGIYYTFAGAAIDLPVNDRNIFTAFVGVQEFTGDNERLHLRGNYVHVLDPEKGLSAQLRTRYFSSSVPGEYDYYSPRWYAQVLPVLQMRRYVGGWQLLGAAGLGAQRDSGSKWQSSRYLNGRVTSPRFKRDWALNANLTYSNTPVGTGFTYSYLQFGFGVTRAF